MTPSVLAGTILAGALSGTLIGAVGIGGVLLAPLLLLITPFELGTIMAATAFSFVFTGVVGGVAYARRGSVPWRDAGWLAASVVPAAFAGARTHAVAPEGVPAAALAALLVVAAAQALRAPPPRSGARRRLPAPLLVGLGAFVGFGSALTGTGGPVLLVPLLLLLGAPPLAAVGTAQVVQLPLAIFASAGFAVAGRLDPALGLVLGLSQAGAVAVGARAAHALPTAALRRLVGAASAGAALLLATRLLPA